MPSAPFIFSTLSTSIDIQENVSLAPFTTLKIGGPARYFVRAENEEAIRDSFEFAEKKDLEVFVLGGGSNILVSDKGFDGLVIQVALKGKSEIPDRDGSRTRMVILRANAGENWDTFVDYCVKNNLGGIECLSGIPGSVGGTPVQNVGAYGQDVSERIIFVQCLDRTTGNVIQLSKADCGFGYRKSIFNTDQENRYVVLAVFYLLSPGGQPKIVYKDLLDVFGGRHPSLQETRDAVLKIRRSKSMVIDPADPNSLSVGSFFKNPIIPNEKYAQIAAVFDGPVPKFPSDDHNLKIPAAWLIENSGFHKGYRLGNAGISTKHTLAIVNCGGATAKEVVDLKLSIQGGVEQKFGIRLQPEPIFVGF